MQCPHCHADGQDGRFCKKCGKPLDQDVSDMTRVMPPLEALHEKPTETAPDDEAQAAADALTEALDEAEAGEEQTATAPDAVAANTDTTDEGSPETTKHPTRNRQRTAKRMMKKPQKPTTLAKNFQKTPKNRQKKMRPQTNHSCQLSCSKKTATATIFQKIQCRSAAKNF